MHTILLFTGNVPISLSIIYCVIFIIDSSILVKILAKKIFSKSPSRIKIYERDFQVQRDIIFDFILASTPILIPYYFYSIGSSVFDTFQIIFVTSISLGSKLRSMFKETISWNLDSMIVKRQTQNSRTFHRHRKSIYMITKMEKVEYIQNRYFTRPYKIAVCLLGFCHLCLFIVTFFTQITYAINLNMHNTKCHERYTYNNSYNKKNSIWQLNTIIMPE